MRMAGSSIFDPARYIFAVTAGNGGRRGSSRFRLITISGLCGVRMAAKRNFASDHRPETRNPDEVKHGRRIHCPNCYNPGRLCNCESETVCYLDSIWWNPKTKRWECTECFAK